MPQARVALLLAAVAMLTAGWAGRAAAQGEPPSQRIEQRLPAGGPRSTVAFTLTDIGESRLGLQFELPLAVAQARLVDPGGRETLLMPGRDLKVTEAAQRAQPQRGHLHLLLQPRIDPPPGHWRLDLDHAAARGGERLQVVVSHLPRFALQLGLVGQPGQRLGVGSEVLLELRSSDHGLAQLGASPRASWWHADSGRRQVLAFWHERPAGYDLPVQADPGQRFAVFAPEAPGRHVVEVQQDVVGRDGRRLTLQRELALDVAAQPVLQQLELAQPAGPTGCVPRVRFAVEWPARQPGRHVLTVVLEGDGRPLVVRGGQDAQRPGPLRLQADAAARDLLALGADVRVRRVDLLRLSDSGVELLQRRRALPVSEPLAIERLCR